MGLVVIHLSFLRYMWDKGVCIREVCLSEEQWSEAKEHPGSKYTEQH